MLTKVSTVLCVPAVLGALARAVPAQVSVGSFALLGVGMVLTGVAEQRRRRG